MKDVVDFMFGTEKECQVKGKFPEPGDEEFIDTKQATAVEGLNECHRMLVEIENMYDRFGLDLKFMLSAARLNISVARNMIENPR